jgi:hypothetical protein
MAGDGRSSQPLFCSMSCTSGVGVVSAITVLVARRRSFMSIGRLALRWASSTRQVEAM